MQFLKFTPAFLIMVITIFAIQCDVSDDNNTSSSNIGTMVVWLTDAPVDFPNIKEINLTIEDISVRSAETGESILLQDEQVNINIMEFRNGNMQIIAGSNRVAVGFFDQIQFQIMDVIVELKNGEDIDVPVPLRARNGYTVDLSPSAEVFGGGNTEILLDLDLYQSFTQQSDGDNFFPDFNFDPVIRYAILGNTGNITGIVLTERNTLIENSLIRLFSGSQLVSTTFSEPNGEFAFVGLEPGVFTLRTEKEGFQAVTREVEVEVRQATDITFTLDSLTTAP